MITTANVSCKFSKRICKYELIKHFDNLVIVCNATAFSIDTVPSKYEANIDVIDTILIQ